MIRMLCEVVGIDGFYKEFTKWVKMYWHKWNKETR